MNVYFFTPCGIYWGNVILGWNLFPPRDSNRTETLEMRWILLTFTAWLLLTVGAISLYQDARVRALRTGTVYAGQPTSCPVPGHPGPPCNMGKCAALDKDGKLTGFQCSKYCAKSCCLCEDKCPKDTLPPDEGEPQ